MFVVCPSCAGPFRIPADQIAPLVQIACPHCAYRMILDFEAANDPSLVEPGHLMAQGFETAEQYFSVYSHIGPQTEVKPRPVEPARPAEPVAQPKPVVTTPATPPSTPPVQARPVQVAKTPTGPQPVVEAPAASQSQPAAPVKQVGNKTIIRTPEKPKALDTSRPEPVAKQPSGPTGRAGRGSDMVTEPATPAVETEAAAERRPPHTPPAPTAVSNAPSTPEPVAQTKPEDIAAQSGSHPAKPAETKPAETTPAETPTETKPVASEPTKPAPGGEAKPPTPTTEGGSNTMLIVIVLVVLLVIGLLVFMNR